VTREAVCPHCLEPLNVTLGEWEICEVIETAAALTKVRAEQIQGTTLIDRAVQARHATWATMRRIYNLSYPELGAIFDRHHTSIMHGVKRINNTHPELVDQIIDQLATQEPIPT